MDMDTIAERSLVIDCGDRKLEASVRLGCPVLDASGENWMCPYEVKVENESKSFRIHGIDSMQALVLAMKTLDVEIEVIAKKLGGTPQWLGEPFNSILGSR